MVRKLNYYSDSATYLTTATISIHHKAYRDEQFWADDRMTVEKAVAACREFMFVDNGADKYFIAALSTAPNVFDGRDWTTDTAPLLYVLPIRWKDALRKRLQQRQCRENTSGSLAIKPFIETAGTSRPDGADILSST